MWKIRPGFAAWLLFALACLVPGWLLREPLAAEVQLRCARPPLGREKWRVLGPGGPEYLVRVLRSSPLAWRRRNAAGCLWFYDDASVCKARIEAYIDPDPSVGNAANMFLDESNPGDIAGAFDELGDERLLQVLGHPQICDGRVLFALLWVLRPVMAERIASRLLRETADPVVVDEAAVSRGGIYHRAALMFLWWTDDRRRRMLREGLKNPNAAIRRLCQERLDREEGMHGGQRPDR